MNRAPHGALRTIQKKIDARDVAVDEPNRLQGLGGDRRPPGAVRRHRGRLPGPGERHLPRPAGTLPPGGLHPPNRRGRSVG